MCFPCFYCCYFSPIFGLDTYYVLLVTPSTLLHIDTVGRWLADMFAKKATYVNGRTSKLVSTCAYIGSQVSREWNLTFKSSAPYECLPDIIISALVY